MNDTVTLEQLRERAAANPETVFQVLSCEACLAAQVAGKEMAGHWQFAGGGEVEKKYGLFTAHVGQARTDEAYARFPKYEPRMQFYNDTIDAPLLGRELVVAIDRLIAGDDPQTVAKETWEQREGRGK